jgi:3-oxoacyl-[acyl-carrier protein] reductase
MDLGIAGRTAAVAAASSGLGFATALALAAEGVRVAVCGRDRARLEAAAARIDGAVPLVADVSTVAGATGFVDAATEALGHLDILVPNAGGPPPGTFASTPLEAYLPALELNLLSTVAMCEAAVPAMCERGWGRVVAITSVTVRQPSPVLILSNTARAGVTGFLKTLALEVAHRGVTVNSVQPGLHLTDRARRLYGGGDDDRGDDDGGGGVAAAAAGVPTGVLGDPADFGATVAFLCSVHARFVVGAALPVDGGTYQGLQ